MFICKTDRRLEGRFNKVQSFQRLSEVLEDYLDEKMLTSYRELHRYWTDKRVIGSSSRLNQSEAFILEQQREALKEIAFISARQLSRLK